ncbi:hypothetical protein Scep_005226 [Stephania cephalantha]|uniref:Uncharacterized protein n=1 Tax=Stephania cephalantha TaxID=152367 RepID=A0AAP0KTW8_9MAGN
MAAIAQGRGGGRRGREGKEQGRGTARESVAQDNATADGGSGAKASSGVQIWRGGGGQEGASSNDAPRWRIATTKRRSSASAMASDGRTRRANDSDGDATRLRRGSAGGEATRGE